MSKKIKLVRSIGGVIGAFLNGEQASAAMPITTKCGRLVFSADRLYYADEHRAPALTRIIGVLIKPGKEAIVTNRSHDWTTYIDKALREHTGGIKVHRLRFTWYAINVTELDYRHVMEEIFRALEGDARVKEDQTRDEVVAQWNYICHGIGFGHLVGPPPDTGY